MYTILTIPIYRLKYNMSSTKREVKVTMGKRNDNPFNKTNDKRDDDHYMEMYENLNAKEFFNLISTMYHKGNNDVNNINDWKNIMRIFAEKYLKDQRVKNPRDIEVCCVKAPDPNDDFEMEGYDKYVNIENQIRDHFAKKHGDIVSIHRFSLSYVYTDVEVTDYGDWYKVKDENEIYICFCVTESGIDVACLSKDDEDDEIYVDDSDITLKDAITLCMSDTYEHYNKKGELFDESTIYDVFTPKQIGQMIKTHYGL